MAPLTLFAVKPLTVMFPIAMIFAYLLNVADQLSGIVNALIAGIVTLVGAWFALWLKRKFSLQDTQSIQNATLQLHITEAGEAVAKLSAESRKDADARVDGYVTKLENFYKQEREFFVDRDKQKDTLIVAQKEIIDSLRLVVATQRFQANQAVLGKEPS